ncbi:MAG: hypothetical protein DCC68_08385 [Planctomycetota bacterium]|nr:MAG: hypothetical protein DCC68_08385 [Planctomycetota bacterium]
MSENGRLAEAERRVKDGRSGDVFRYRSRKAGRIRQLTASLPTAGKLQAGSREQRSVETLPGRTARSARMAYDDASAAAYRSRLFA